MSRVAVVVAYLALACAAAPEGLAPQDSGAPAEVAAPAAQPCDPYAGTTCAPGACGLACVNNTTAWACGQLRPRTGGAPCAGQEQCGLAEACWGGYCRALCSDDKNCAAPAKCREDWVLACGPPPGARARLCLPP